MKIGEITSNQEFRFPVQWVNRPNSEFRGFSGTIAGGMISVGDPICVLPSGKQSTIKSINTFDGDLASASVGQAITLVLTDEIDVSRGDMICHQDKQAQLGNSFEADIVWMSEDALMPNKQYDFKFTGKYASGSIVEVLNRIDINSLQQCEATHLELNEIGPCQVKLTQQVAYDSYKTNRQTGAFIIIDRLSNITVAAGMIKHPLNLDDKDSTNLNISEFEMAFNALVRKHFPHWGAQDISNLFKK